MKVLRYILLVVVVMFAFNVKAASDTCDRNELIRLKEIAKKVEFDYDYKVVNRVASFSIRAVNLNKEIKVRIIEDYYKGKYKEFKDDGTTHTATLNNFLTGEKVPITITAYVSNGCSGEVLLKQTIKLPYYNYYYSPDRCKGYEDFKYCKILINDKIDEAKFEKEFYLYLKKLAQEQAKQSEGPEENNNLKYIIIGVVSFIVLILAIIIISRSIAKIRKRNSL